MTTRKITLTLSPDRWEWLELMAEYRGKTVEEVIAAEIHNATLDFQRDNFPASDPTKGVARQVLPEG